MYRYNPRFKLVKNTSFVKLTGILTYSLGKYKKVKGNHKNIQGGWGAGRGWGGKAPPCIFWCFALIFSYFPRTNVKIPVNLEKHIVFYLFEPRVIFLFLGSPGQWHFFKRGSGIYNCFLNIITFFYVAIFFNDVSYMLLSLSLYIYIYICRFYEGFSYVSRICMNFPIFSCPALVGGTQPDYRHWARPSPGQRPWAPSRLSSGHWKATGHPTIGGVHKIQIPIRDLLKELTTFYRVRFSWTTRSRLTNYVLGPKKSDSPSKTTCIFKFWGL